MEKSFKDTLNLPKTDFSIRANAAEKEKEILSRWENDALYAKAVERKGDDSFILHDGPPFANGHMHIGHALNRTLKDFVCKSKRMFGYNVISHPGWDCHGLPIEIKVAQELGVGSDRVAFKKKCREYAQKWIDVQREEIKRLGVITDWNNPYITMSPLYEAGILKSFAVFVEKGYIERKGKTVPWCASCQTVLATAEIEYQDKTDPSCYILFPLAEEILPGHEVNLLAWTTTPWTIPLNRAVVIHPTAPYVVCAGKDNQAFIVGEALADKVCGQIGIEKKVLAKISPTDLKGKKVHHPYIDQLQVPIILDDMVLLEDGTACVHSAPGCGPEDYVLGIKNGLEIFSPLSSDGKYTEGIMPKELENMPVTDGQIWSIKKLAEKGRLLHKSSMKHSYPHCWRCHNPLIFRATDQWFCDLRHDNLVDRSLEAIKKISFVPDWGSARLGSSIASRSEWCLSRQRQWGVPIPAIMCEKCDHAHLSASFIRVVAEHVAKEGVEFWDRVSINDLVVLKLLSSTFSCEKCGNNDLSQFRKEMDIVDVWFESGVSHTAVREQYPDLNLPADLYLEGSDQHRGWFQSSLLSSMIMYNQTCTKSFVTHAYVLDAQAQKMSKSKGNVISPQDVMTRYSADILRLWVAGSDFEDDVVVSEELLKNVAEVYRKVRNTCRFMISNMFDFDPEKDLVAIEKLPFLDQYALATLQDITIAVEDAYKNYHFTTVFHTLNRYCTNDLSSFYLDVIKDRLYTEKSDGHLRRSAQTVMYHVLDSLTRLMAPVLSFLAEEVSDFYQKGKTESIHLQLFPEPIKVWQSSKEAAWWALLESIRPELLKAIEAQREVGLVKHSLEAKVTIHVDPSDEQGKAFLALIDYVQSREVVTRFFKDFVIVSQFEWVASAAGLETTRLPWLSVKVEHADGTKCPRCWQWDTTTHEDGLCHRCEKVV